MLQRLLICLDDLDHSKSIVEYAARIMRDKDDVEITLLHCIRSKDIDLGANELILNEADKVSIDRLLSEYFASKKEEEEFSCQDLYNSARRILTDHGIRDDRITDKLIVKDAEAAACILQEAYNNNHDTIVVGKRRELKLPITKLGAVAEHVLTNAIGKTIWLVSVVLSIASRER
jgi:nucleotide-binding universal stress UspA family protein